MEARLASKLSLGGSLGALAGAVGLVRLGSAPFLVFRDVLLTRGGDPLPEPLRDVGSLALFSLLFGAATAVALYGLLQLTRTAPLRSHGLILLIASGAASAAGGTGLWMGASRELASLRVVAASESLPTTEQISGALEYALGPARIGFAGLLAGTVLLLVLSCGRQPHAPPQTRPGGPELVVGGLSAAGAVGFALVLAATWGPLHTLQTYFSSGGAVRASEVALSISRTLELSALAAALLLVHGVLLLLLGILLLRGSNVQPRAS